MNKFEPWILAARPKTLFASLSPIIIGLSLSFYIHNQINLIVGIMTIVSALLIQIGSNYANDAYDYLKGADSDNRKGPVRMAQEGILSPYAILNMMYLFFLISVIIGFYLALIGGWPIVIIGLSSIIFAIIYTGGPFPLGYNGLGDIFVFIFFGLVATIGTIYLQSAIFGNFNIMKNYIMEIILVSCGVGCLNTAILVVNNLRDYDIDKKSNKKTLVVFFGQKFACFEYLTLLIINSACFIIVGAIMDNLIVVSIMSFSMVSTIFLIIKIFNYKYVNLNTLLEKTAKFTFLHSLLFSVSICIICI